MINRIYNVPLRKEFLKVPKYKRAKKASKALREFLIKHMKSENVIIGKEVNEEIWRHGIKNPPHHVKINVQKDEKGEVVAELFGKPFPIRGKDKKKEEKKGKNKSENKASEKKIEEAVEEKVIKAKPVKSEVEKTESVEGDKPELEKTEEVSELEKLSEEQPKPKKPAKKPAKKKAEEKTE